MSFFHEVLEWAHIIAADKDAATVVIRKGDTLSAIAQGMTECPADEVASRVGEILELNPDIKDKDRIYVGQIVKIPLEWVY
jgi:nucleoid-associated protein YgaU